MTDLTGTYFNYQNWDLWKAVEKKYHNKIISGADSIQFYLKNASQRHAYIESIKEPVYICENVATKIRTTFTEEEILILLEDEKKNSELL
jgi:hypothetical protein